MYVSFFIYFTDFKIRLVHFLSYWTTSAFSIFLFFSKNGPLFLEQIIFSVSIIQVHNFSPEWRGNNNLSVSKHKVLV